MVIARRHCLLASLAIAGGCASEAPAGPTAPPSPEPLLVPQRSLAGGFLAPPTAGVGLPARPTGMFAKLASPTALALRDQELLVADIVTGRLWRADLFAGTFSGIAGAPVGPQMALALGPDGSAWVLDPGARQVLRFARDGRLLQTWRIDRELPSPVALALADQGATLLLADGAGAAWSEQRGPSGIVQIVRPVAPARDGLRISGVDALADAPRGLFVLDRLAGAVHVVARDGTVLDTLGRGTLRQPQALVSDRLGRAFVLDGADLVVLQAGAAPRRIALETLEVRRPGGIASDGRMLAIADALGGQVHLWRIGRGDAP
jgi:hypothetical protein